MKTKRRLCAGVCAGLAALSLCGCASILERQYTSVEPHSKKYWESEASDTLRAESHQELVNALLELIGRHTEEATIRYYSGEDASAPADVLERATAEVQQETPLGAYAVEYITSSCEDQRSYAEITVHIRYRRTQEQIQALVNATSTAALPDLLNAAADAGKEELGVRISYWDETSADQVYRMVQEVCEARGIPEDETWSVLFYPADGPVGLLEFQLGPGEEAGKSEEKPAETT